MCTSQRAVEDAFVGYFHSIFTAGDNLRVAACIRHVEWKVTPSMNNELLAEFTMEDIGQALQQMAPLNAPGPDDFPAVFYQQNWSTVTTHPQ
jgi:Mg/Co/Ni transporter MgtE